jgi:hypothetical protein
MGLNTIPAVSGLTRNVVAFTSSQTWTVPSTAQYVDVLVVGGGSGGYGGYRYNSSSSYAGNGGAVCIGKNIYLGGTGTVSITVGAGSNGTTGTATTSNTAPSDAGYSAFGNLIYAGGASRTVIGGMPGYKGSMLSYGYGVNSGDPSIDSNSAGINSLTYGGRGFRTSNSADANYFGLGLDVIGLRGGSGGVPDTTNTSSDIAGGIPGGGLSQSTANNFTLSTFPSLNWFNVNSYLGAATAGTTGGAGGTAGPAGVTGIAGGGGTPYYGTGQHGQGGPGAGGGGGQGGKQLGGSGNGGNGGNAGTNTGAGGGAGGNTGSTTAGTGGNGGNGGSGIVVVSWLG